MKERIRYAISLTCSPTGQLFFVYAEDEADARNRTGCYEGYSCSPAGHFDSARCEIVGDPDVSTMQDGPRLPVAVCAVLQ